MPGEGDNVFTGPLSNPTIRQIFVWGVAINVLGRAMDPFLTQLSQVANASHPDHVLSPAELADMVVRHRVDTDTAKTEASGSGINGDRFDLMVKNVGEPPGLSDVLEMWRRGFLDDWPGGPEDAIAEAVHTARLMDEWLPYLKRMRYTVPGAAEVVDAVVKAHLEPEEAKRKFSEAGLNPDVDFDWLVGTRGNPPGLDEVASMVHRGLIPETGTGPDAVSFQQAVRESAYMNKWSDVLFAARTYIPPVRTIVALLRASAITPDQAAKLFEENGVRPDDAAAYIAEGTGAVIAEDKKLAKADVEALYFDQAIDRGQATTMLGALGYATEIADWLLTMIDFRREQSALGSAVTRVGTYFISRKVTKADASKALDSLRVSAAQRDKLLATWEVERTSNVKLLTAAEIAEAFKYNVMDQAQAQEELEALGYTPYDAWVRLSVTMHTSLPNPPKRTTLLTPGA